MDPNKPPPPVTPPTARTATVVRGGAFTVVVFWVLVMGLLYAAMRYTLQAAPVVISTSGDLVIPKARDGHFYAPGTVNGQPVMFLVDTGASLVTVSEAFAQRAGLAPGRPMLFKTANGNLRGRIVQGVSVGVGPIQVSAVQVGVGLVGGDADQALLGQSFLSQFDVLVSKDQMQLRLR
jgi:aspartyl protease family protein